MKRAACWIPGMLVVMASGAGCQMRGHHDAAPPTNTAEDSGEPAASESEKHVVVFAPVALGPLATIAPADRTGFSNDLAKRLSWKAGDLDGQAPADLPDSDAQDWKDGTVPAAAGASLVVLTSVCAVDATSKPALVMVTVEMKAMDPSGATVFDKKAQGQASTSPSDLSSSSKPESLAAWDACTTLLGGLTTVVDARANPTPAPAPASKIPVAIDSDPPHAQILIDGTASGTTPATLPLTPQSHTVRIELSGYAAWERKDIVPSSDMRIQPRLHKQGDDVASTPSAHADATTGASPVPPRVEPKRAEIDPTAAPPTPAQLVVPDEK